MTPANITALQALVQADPALVQQLQSATTNEAATQLLAKAASQKGLAVDAHAIADYLKTAQTGEISDAELEAVAGGVSPSSNPRISTTQPTRPSRPIGSAETSGDAKANQASARDNDTPALGRCG